MNAYAYAGDLLCEDCSQHAINAQGPFAGGGGEADAPRHCDRCDVFLMNSLTDDGRAYVRKAIENHDLYGTGNADVIAEWRDFYGDMIDLGELA
jgi:hypothetical protein